MGETRKLAAILVSDVVGYSRLAGADEDRILARLRALRSDLIDPTIAVHHGRVVKRTGDGAIVEFRSVVDAVNCAIEIQRAMVERNAGVAPDKRIEFRIGIHLGDVVEESDGDLMGDGVNIAARLEGIAKPGAICLSEDAYRQVKGRLDLAVTDLGPTQLKNIAEPIRVYSLEVGARAGEARAGPSARKIRPAAPLDGRLAVRQYRRRPGAGAFRRRGHGEPHDRSLAHSGAFVIARNTAFTYKGKAVDREGRSGASSTSATSSKAASSAAETACASTCSSSTPKPAIISGPSGSTSRSPISSTCRTKSSRASPTALNAQLVAAEARRAEQPPNPDSMDHYFQGLAWLNKGATPTPRHKRAASSTARSTSIPTMSTRWSDRAGGLIVGANFFVTEPTAAFAAAEAKLAKALPRSRTMRAHICTWDLDDIFTNRAAKGIAECERALAARPKSRRGPRMDRAWQDFRRRAEETEAHVLEALRISPRDTSPTSGCIIAGIAKISLAVTRKRSRG